MSDERRAMSGEETHNSQLTAHSLWLCHIFSHIGFYSANMADFGLLLPLWHYFSNRGIQEEVTRLNHSDSSRGAICANALSLK